MTQVLFQLLPLHWDLEKVSLCMNLISHSPPVLLDVSPVDFERHTLWDLIFPMQVSWSGSLK